MPGKAITERSSGVRDFRRTEELEFGTLLREPYHAFEFESDSFQHGDRTGILRRRDGDNALQLEDSLTVDQNCGCGFDRIPFRTVPRQKRESHVRLAQAVTLDQAPNPDRSPIANAG